MPTLGEKIRTLRKKAGLTLEQLADQIQASKSSVWELENKEKARPSADRIHEIARVLGVTPEFLLNDEATEATTSDLETAFFRRYQNLPTSTKKQLEDILNVLDRKADT